MSGIKSTLADETIRECFRPHSILSRIMLRPLHAVRQDIAEARKIVLDRDMSRFLADLSLAPFSANPENRFEVLNALRHGARLPHPKTWIEYDGRAFRERTIELKGTMVSLTDKLNIYEAPRSIDGTPLADPHEVPERYGYLLREHPQVPSAVRGTEFCWLGTTTDHEHDMVGTVPFDYVWQCDDNPLPWNDVDTNASMMLSGVTPFISPHIGAIYNLKGLPHKDDWVEVTTQGALAQTNKVKMVVPRLLVEMTGAVRYLMAFLATFNDMPVNYESVRSSKGYVARGRYRKNSDHTVLHINIPARKDPRVVALKLTVLARRKWHEVRGHFRVFTHHAQHPGKLCSPAFHHGPFATFGSTNDAGYQHCSKCEAQRRWIDKHYRGDPKLGVVLHDYAIHHEVKKENAA